MLTIETIRQHCRIDGTEDDALLLLRAKAVEQMAEQETGRTFTERTRTLELESFGAGEIDLPGAPVTSITQITYLDSTGTRVPLDASKFRLYAGDLRAYAWAPNGWPSAKQEPGSVKIIYVAGYGTDEADLPESARAWMLLHIAHLTRNPEAATDKVMTALPYADGLIDWMRVYR